MSEPPPPRDEALSRLLQSWPAELPDDPALARKVWARIETKNESRPAGWAAWVSELFTRPALALAVLAGCVALGALTAQLRWSDGSESHIERLAAEYARSIDPLWMTHADHSGHTP